MNNPNAPVLDRTTTSGCTCFNDAPPLPMGCAVCGHAPYAHHCPGQANDHEYAQPTGTLMAMRLEARRRTGPQPFPLVEQPVVVAPAEVIPLVPAQRRSEPPAPTAPIEPTPLPERTPRPSPRPALRPAATAPARRDDSRRPAPRPVETRTDRATRLALARDTLAHRRARIAARAHDHSASPPSTGLKPATWPLAPQTLRPGPTAAPGRSRPPNTPAPRRHQPHRWEAAA
ncbi:hypothetical protein ABT352_03505 [Streptosporangium sp. NPDC000563]|uniref:hypothetical protein n=1 Tax=Streptosporangium sp. NPDC000563 TaxID=3154366 RepID=UPI00331E2046